MEELRTLVDVSRPRWFALRPIVQGRRLRRALVSVALVLGAWEIFGAAGKINPFAFSWPSRIALELGRMVMGGSLWPDLALSTMEFLVGFGLAVAVGIPLGLLVAYFKVLEVGLGGYITALYVTPTVALAPILVLWFGLGPGSKIAVVFAMSFFPIMLNAMAGVQNAPAQLLRAARSFGATDLQMLRTVLLPASLPFILAGVRIGIGRGIVGLVVGEMIASSAGVGFRILMAASKFRNAEYLAGVFVLLVMSMVAVEFVRYLEHRLVPWQRRQ